MKEAGLEKSAQWDSWAVVPGQESTCGITSPVSLHLYSLLAVAKKGTDSSAHRLINSREDALPLCILMSSGVKSSQSCFKDSMSQ